MIYLNEETTRQRITHELAYAAVKDAYLAVGESATLFPVVNAAGDQPGSMFSLKSASTPNVVGWKTGSYGSKIRIKECLAIILRSFYWIQKRVG